MDPSHRIQSLSVAPTVERQTPRNEFGEVLAQAVGGGANLASSLLLGKPALSAAVAVGSAISAGTTHAAAAIPVAGAAASAGASAAGSASTQGSGMDLLDAQRALQAEGQQFNAAYLQLQDQMQRESREFNAVSNIMKVRHDSAKAAINNIH